MSPRRIPSTLEGRLWVLAAALLWSTGGLFAKAPIFDDCPLAIRAPMFAFWRAFFAALVLLPMVRRPRFRGLLVPLVLVFTAMNVTYLASLTRTTAANAIWLQATAPWWVFLFSVSLFRQPIVRRDLIPLAFGCLGVGAILTFELRGQAQFGVLAGLASGIGYAMVLVLLHQLGRENSAWLVAICHAVAALAMLPWVIYLGWWPSLAQLLVLAGFGALQMGIPYTFITFGMRSVSSQEAVGIALVEPILMPLWVFLFYHEVPALWTMVGAALILVGLVLRYVVWELLANSE
ncbi:MAG: EamA family transporter [Planctomycetes bacterium]|nr:EamA family transporter [Planctomycetota bacterium]